MLGIEVVLLLYVVAFPFPTSSDLTPKNDAGNIGVVQAAFGGISWRQGSMRCIWSESCFRKAAFPWIYLSKRSVICPWYSADDVAA